MLTGEYVMFQIFIHQNSYPNYAPADATQFGKSSHCFLASHFTSAFSNIWISCLCQIISIAKIRHCFPCSKTEIFISSPLNRWNHLLSDLISTGTAPDCAPVSLPSCLQNLQASQIICVLDLLHWYITDCGLAGYTSPSPSSSPPQNEWCCYWPKVTHSPRFRKSVRAETRELECRRETSAAVMAKQTHTWVWVVQWAPPCSTWPTPFCLCWWSRGQDRMVSHYRPLPVHSSSAPAQCLGSTTEQRKEKKPTNTQDRHAHMALV